MQLARWQPKLVPSLAFFLAPSCSSVIALLISLIASSFFFLPSSPSTPFSPPSTVSPVFLTSHSLVRSNLLSSIITDQLFPIPQPPEFRFLTSILRTFCRQPDPRRLRNTSFSTSDLSNPPSSNDIKIINLSRCHPKRALAPPQRSLQHLLDPLLRTVLLLVRLPQFRKFHFLDYEILLPNLEEIFADTLSSEWYFHRSFTAFH